MCLNKRLKPRRIAGDLICHDGSDGTIPKHRQDDVATHSSLGLVNTSAMITTGNPSWRHCISHVCTRQLQIEVVNVNNESPMRSIVFFLGLLDKNPLLWRNYVDHFLHSSMFFAVSPQNSIQIRFTGLIKWRESPSYSQITPIPTAMAFTAHLPLWESITTHSYPHSSDLSCTPAFMGVYHKSQLTPIPTAVTLAAHLPLWESITSHNSLLSPQQWP